MLTVTPAVNQSVMTFIVYYTSIIRLLSVPSRTQSLKSQKIWWTRLLFIRRQTNREEVLLLLWP